MQDYNQPTDAAMETPAPTNPLSLTGQRAIQGSDQPALDATPDDQPTEFQGQTATNEFGDARRVETGAEKPEVRIFHDTVPEGIYGEGRGGRG